MADINIKPVLFDVTAVILGTLVAYVSLLEIGVFMHNTSPTLVFGVSLILIFMCSHRFLKSLANHFIPSTSVFHCDVAQLLGLDPGQAPYLNSLGYIAVGMVISTFGAPYMNQLHEMQGTQFIWLSIFFFSGIACVIWGLLLAFLTAIRLPNDD